MIKQLPKRINNDLALFTNGVDQYIDLLHALDSRYDFGAGEWAVILNINCVSDLSGRAFHLQLGSCVVSILIQENEVSFLAISAEGNNYLDNPTDDQVTNPGAVSTVMICRKGNEILAGYNGKIVYSVPCTPSDTFSFDGGNFKAQTRTNAASQFNEGMINHLVVLNKGLNTSQFRSYANSIGFIPKDLHSSILNHWPLTQKNYYKADASFASKYPDFSVDDVAAWDVVEQYNYSNPYSIDNDYNNWALSGANMSSNGPGDEISYDGSGAGARGANEPITGLVNPGDVGKYIRVTFEVLSLSAGGKFWVYIGGSSPTAHRVEINTTGPQEVYIRYGGGTPNIFIFNTNGITNDLTATWTVGEIETIGLKAPIHATLEGFTDAEVGADQPANQTQIFDIKSKSLSKNWGLKFPDIAGNRRLIVDTSGGNIITTNNNFALFFEVNIYDDIPNQAEVRIDDNNGGTAQFELRINQNASNIVITLSSIVPAVDTAQFAIPNGLIVGKGFKRFCLIKTTDNTDDWLLWWKLGHIENQQNGLYNLIGNDIASYSFGDIFLGYGNPTRQARNIIFSEFAIFDGIPTLEQLIQWRDKEPLTFLEVLNFGKVLPFSNGSNTLIGARPQTFEDFTDGEEVELFVERQSGLPEIKNAIDMDGGTRSIDIPSVQSSSLEMILKCDTDISDLDDLFTFGAGITITGTYFNGVEVLNEAALIDAINTNSICHIAIIYNQLTTTISIDDFDGYVMQLGLNWNNPERKEQSKKSIVKAFNNSLLRPVTENRSNYYLFNSENDGLDYIGRDNATLNNITATEIVDIDTLR